MPKRSYSAVRLRQTAEASDLVLFAAPALDIEDWSGIPQRERLGSDAEAVGFQRTENPKRLDELAAFFQDGRNVIQNPLLCASRDSTKIKFEVTPGAEEDHPVVNGQVTVEWEDLSQLPLLEILSRVKFQLESRIPELGTATIGDGKLMQLKERANTAHPDLMPQGDEGTDGEFDDDDDDDDDALRGEDDSDDPAGAVVFSDETHIADFWEEVAARVSILQEIGPTFAENTFLGFSKESMVSFLQPIVVVDGQHRLRGSILAAKRTIDSEELRAEIESAIEEGGDPDEISDRLRRREARILPVSLLLQPSPAEHVFQFVVVNQKATPIGRALLGTIVSTSLSAEELREVSERLTAAGIPLEDSQAIAYLTRHPDSPFRDLVEKGLANEGTADLLQWNVLRSLARTFRELKGGRLDHEKLDYADKWRRTSLESASIVPDPLDGETKMALWSRPDGPWRDVFISFWSAVRDRLATTEDRDAGNYWGSPRKSNLFNKISLNILTADFFQFMTDRGYTIDSGADVKKHVDEWLTDVKTSYFSRDWKLTGVKKDSPGVRGQWAYVWVQYRKDPQTLPPVSKFRQLKS